MRTETKIKITNLLRDIEFFSKTEPISAIEIGELAAKHKTTRAIPWFLTTMGVLQKDGKNRRWVNPDNLSNEKILQKVERMQRDSNVSCMRKRRELDRLQSLDAMRRNPQPENFKKNEPIKIDFPSPKQILSTSQFLDQLPIETIIAHVQSKGYIVLKP